MLKFWTCLRISIQGDKSLGGHFACLCQGFDFYGVKNKDKKFLPDKENGNLKPLLNPNALGSVWLVSNLKEVNSADNLIEELNNTNFSDTALILKKDVISNIENKYVI